MIALSNQKYDEALLRIVHISYSSNVFSNSCLLVLHELNLHIYVIFVVSTVVLTDQIIRKYYTTNNLYFC